MVNHEVGSATSPRPGKGRGVIIAHLCNSVGGWGRGFVLAVDKLSPAPCAAYRALASQHASGKVTSIPLGEVQFVECTKGLFVANMIAQDRYAEDHEDGCAVDYAALRECLRVVFHRACRLGYQVHLPEGIGAGLAGGDKDKIHALIREVTDEVESCKFAQHNRASVSVTLWEFQDTSADSYIPQDEEESSPVAADDDDDLSGWG